MNPSIGHPHVSKVWQIAGVAVLFHLLLFVSMPNAGYSNDLACWDWWLYTIYKYGLANCYQHATIEYPPVYIYLLGLWQWLFFDFNRELATQHYLYKYIPWCFSLVGSVWLPVYLHQQKMPPAYSLLFLCSVGLWYNFYAWGQIDVIHTLFISLAVCSVMGNKLPVGAFFFLLALNTKAQTLVFVPFFAILWAAKAGFGRKTWVITFLLLVFVQVLLLLPFFLAQDSSKVYQSISTSVDRYNNVSFFAFNLWHLIFSNPYTLPDTLTFGLFTLKQWGLLLLFANLGLLLCPMLYYLYAHKQPESRQAQLSYFFLLFGLVGIAFFYFPTQIHERYLHPAVAFLGFYAIFSRQYLLFAGASVAYLVNMEAVLHFTGLPFWQYTPTITSGLLLAVYLAGILQFYALTFYPSFSFLFLLNRTQRLFIK